MKSDVDESETGRSGGVDGRGRNVKLIGKVTKGVLGGFRGVTEKCAKVAHGVTEKVSDAVGGVIGGNPIMKNFRNAPVESKRYRFQKVLLAGMVAVGRVYLKLMRRAK